MKIQGMVSRTKGVGIPVKIRLIFFISIYVVNIHAQQDTLEGRNLYNPERFRDTLLVPVSQGEPLQSAGDSLAIRLHFVQDSLLAREKFIRDSMQIRKRKLDSLIFLQRELPVLFDAYFKTVREDIIVRYYTISIAGDSVLNDIGYLVLPFTLNQPYTPWKVNLSLAGKTVRIIIDSTIQKISSVQAPFMKCAFTYGNHNTIMVINELSTIQNDPSGQFYKTPFDSVFFDGRNRVVKIKRYIQLYGVVNKTQRGAPLFLTLSQVKQFEYAPDGRIKYYQVVSFCDRRKAYETLKVCNIISWDFTFQNNTYRLTRHNDPANIYSDGTFSFEFDEKENLKGVSFQNLALTESWKRVVELNADGNVNCYVDWKNDRVCQSLCMIYNAKENGVKGPVETITTTYEADGVSYYQKNNSTGLSRIRDKMTMEWGPWK
jgi:hypothetical protein